ncbi:tetratricopeptide repeat protein [Brevundimonas sp. CEF1]|uniref:tetratricopeptide repeat protein n=1 Tax=Brevundimonas sp. CEF1 TaxID=3442642 RepID=UPI003F515E9F
MIDLFRSENVVVRAVPVEDVSRWVVTFDNYGIGHGFDRPAFGESFLRHAGVSAVHVMGSREEWYQYREMAEVMAAVRRITAGAERVMTYGSSMGGYAAIRFADAAGAHAALAISPQYSIDPAKVPFETRWRQEAHGIRWLPEIDGPIKCGCTPIIVFDPTGDDRRHVEMIAAETAIERIDLPHSGHPSATYLSELELLGPLVLQTLSGALNVAGFRADARRRKPQCPAYLSRLAELQPPRRADLALALARRANNLAPANPIALAAVASLLGRLGEHEQALAYHDVLSNVTERAPNYLVLRAQALVDAGRPDEARVLAREIVATSPDTANLWAWLGHIEWQCGAHGAAIKALEHAVGLFPSHADYQLQLDHYRASLPLDTEALPKGGLARVVRTAKLWLRRGAAASQADVDSPG